jgi:serine/threonine-protein kinase
MPLTSPADLVEALRKHRLLEPGQIDEVRRFQPPFASARLLAKELIRRDWLTPYQVNQLFQDRGKDLLLGQYILLERLGEGGMGQVFKARHRTLRRIVALKIIRKERLNRPEVVRRFQREVQAAAQLNHPNVVLAFDADQIGSTHFIAMEYVEGTDLARLLKADGPLPVEQACIYISQAALGLQHAHERGLVHRDIKPANLLVTRIADLDGKLSRHALVGAGGLHPGAGGQVKILDMGLARLNPAMEDDTTRGVTQEGTVIGTVDYLAPEQAVNASNVDIRADIYSLGCTFYHLLTGQVPHPGSTALEKLLKHRLDEVIPVEHLRPEVSPSLAAVVRQMMAKQPRDRYQTPAEVAQALSILVRSGALVRAPAVPVSAGMPAVPEVLPDLAPPVVPAPPTPPELAETAGPWATLPLSQPALPSPYASRRKRNQNQIWYALAAIMAVLAGGVFLLVRLLRP